MTKIRLFAAIAVLSLPLAACGKGGLSPDAACKKMEELATKEGGDAKAAWDSMLSKDCVKEMTEEKKKMGDEKWAKATDCLASAKSFTEAGACAK